MRRLEVLNDGRTRNRKKSQGLVSKLKPIMAEIKLENSSSDQLSREIEGISRRELLKSRAGGLSVAAVSSAFSPIFHSHRASSDKDPVILAVLRP